MTDLKLLVEEEMKKMIAEGPLATTPEDFEPFSLAVLGNENFQNGITNTMSSIAQKFAGVMITGPSAQDVKELLCTRAMAKPLLNMMYTAYRVGLAVAGTKSLEDMFSKEVM